MHIYMCVCVRLSLPPPSLPPIHCTSCMCGGVEWCGVVWGGGVQGLLFSSLLPTTCAYSSFVFFPSFMHPPYPPPSRSPILLPVKGTNATAEGRDTATTAAPIGAAITATAAGVTPSTAVTTAAQPAFLHAATAAAPTPVVCHGKAVHVMRAVGSRNTRTEP
jgi:hypothetical protein